jgi:hypothetical protein
MADIPRKEASDMNRISLFVTSCVILASSIAPKAAYSRLMYQETIGMGGSELITLRGSNMRDIHERIGVLHARLSWILSDSTLTSDDVQIRKMTEGSAVYVKNRLFVTVMAQDAEYNQTTPEKQAEEWREHLAQTLPSLTSSGRITKS